MKLRILFLLILIPGTAVAQQHQHGPMPTPYAGMQQRTVKALSEQQITDLQAGRGMGLAMAAELNGYPGPSHALELADELQLTAEQRFKLQQLFESMKAEATVAGEKLIASESMLDQQFAERVITAASLEALTAQIGKMQGTLRAVHLKYHLTTAKLLSVEQRQRYADLRGYN